MAALLAGQGVLSVAAEYELPPTTVSRWRKEARKEAGRGDVGELLLDYLTEALNTLREQAVVFGDPEWLKAQSASEAGVLHGILCDKSIRLLEAMSTSPLEGAQHE